MRRREKPYQVEREETRKVQLNELNPTYDDCMRSKACDQVTHSRGLTPHRLILWRQIFLPITNGDSVKQNGKLFLRKQSNTVFSFFPKVQNNTLLFTKGVVYRLSHDCHLAIDRDAAHYPRRTISFTTLLLLLILPACLPFLHPVRRLRLHRYTSFRNDLRFFQSRFLFLLKMKQRVKKSQVHKATK